MPSAWRAASGESFSRFAAVAAATKGPQAPWKWCPRMNKAPVAASETRKPTS